MFVAADAHLYTRNTPCGSREHARLEEPLSYPILSSSLLVEEAPGRTARLWTHAPDVVRSWQPGQFVMLRTTEGGERIPVTIAGDDPDASSICLVVQEVGKTTRDIVALGAGDAILDVCGPLGTPSEIDRFGGCVVVAGGYGSAAVLPIARALSAAGNRVTGILGARTARLVVLAEELADATDTFHVATEDGTVGTTGNVLDPLAGVLESEQVDRVLAIGPMPMMAAVADLTRPLGIPTVASLNPIMIDGTGMCGACRVHVGGEIRFACVDGPEFDAHAVDFAELAARLGTYRDQETLAMETHCG